MKDGGTNFFSFHEKHIDMDTKELQQNWPDIKTRIQEQYPHLTEKDLLYEIGREADLLLRLQEKLGKTDKEIREWLSLMG